MKINKYTGQKCKKCGRTIIQGGKWGYCAACVNKYGSRLLIGGAGAAGLGVFILKNAKKIAELATNALKIIK